MCARLEYTARSTEGLRQRQALHDVFRAGLFAIHILARIGGHNRGRRVPVRAGGDEHRINVASSKQLAQIAVHRAILVAILFVSPFLDRLAPLGLYIADSYEPHIRLLQETTQIVRPAVANPDGTQPDLFARRDSSIPAQNRAANHLRRGEYNPRLNGSLQKLPAVRLNS